MSSLWGAATTLPPRRFSFFSSHFGVTIEDVSPSAIALNLAVERLFSLTSITSPTLTRYEGMASRELQDEEKDKLDSQVIATDGIAVIVNKNNTTDELSSDQVKTIYTGDATTWYEVVK